MEKFIITDEVTTSMENKENIPPGFDKLFADQKPTVAAMNVKHNGVATTNEQLLVSEITGADTPPIEVSAEEPNNLANPASPAHATPPTHLIVLTDPNTPVRAATPESSTTSLKSPQGVIFKEVAQSPNDTRNLSEPGQTVDFLESTATSQASVEDVGFTTDFLESAETIFGPLNKGSKRKGSYDDDNTDVDGSECREPAIKLRKGIPFAPSHSEAEYSSSKRYEGWTRYRIPDRKYDVESAAMDKLIKDDRYDRRVEYETRNYNHAIFETTKHRNRQLITAIPPVLRDRTLPKDRDLSGKKSKWDLQREKASPTNVGKETRTRSWKDDNDESKTYFIVPASQPYIGVNGNLTKVENIVNNDFTHSGFTLLDTIKAVNPRTGKEFVKGYKIMHEHMTVGQVNAWGTARKKQAQAVARQKKKDAAALKKREEARLKREAAKQKREAAKQKREASLRA